MEVKVTRISMECDECGEWSTHHIRTKRHGEYPRELYLCPKCLRKLVEETTKLLEEYDETD